MSHENLLAGCVTLIEYSFPNSYSPAQADDVVRRTIGFPYKLWYLIRTDEIQ
jgi:hypothetical protein